MFTSTEISVTLGSPSPSQPSPTPLVAAAFSRTTVRKVLLAAQNRQVALYDVSKRKPVKEFTVGIGKLLKYFHFPFLQAFSSFPSASTLCCVSLATSTTRLPLPAAPAAPSPSTAW